ncbi:hypothetical protein LWE61_15120 [Sphingobium sufflavum]|uniref:Rad52/Rad22 family DNA repair protein n=1 Tax=Sphingobium sufflavum TaxID=1129547 RepID=UPI001F3481DD|nr:Rad52/Rad22 family DNA repair protein [Sphingobium sufflavum]MCE7797880.1 hypothetical protein [Sphingobium sufflavum]
MIDIAALQAPFECHEHSWRAQSVARSATSAQALCYLTSRSVQDRLDSVCTPAGWQGSFAETATGRVIATISINMDGQWIAKSDGAGATAMEGEKGGLSAAFKRAGAMWGIGRYLYSLPAVWAECEVVRNESGPVLRNGKPIWKKWTPRGQSQLEDALHALFERLHHRAAPPAERQPIELTGRRAQEALPAPEQAPIPLSEAPAFKMPPVVSTLINGLAGALKDGSADQFWRDHYRHVPQVWQAFVVAEKERIKREARP